MPRFSSRDTGKAKVTGAQLNFSRRDKALSCGSKLVSQKGVLGKIFGGFQFNGITTIQTGRPIVIQDSSDANLDGVSSDRPDLIGNPNLPRGERTPSRFFNTSAFARVPVRTNRFGNAGRNIVTGPGYNNTDVSLFK